MDYTKELDYLEEIKQLKENWRILASLLEIETKVSVQTRHRMVASSSDIIDFSKIFLDSYLKALYAKRDVNNYSPRPKTKEEFKKYDNEVGEKSFDSGQEYAVCVKALFFFLRALQDNCYAVLLELAGQEPGLYSSMNDCYKKKDSPNFTEINTNLPKYFEWFRTFRGIRDNIKFGRSVGTGYRSVTDEVTVTLRVVKVGTKVCDIERIISLSDIIESLKMSNELIQFLSNKIKNQE